MPKRLVARSLILSLLLLALAGPARAQTAPPDNYFQKIVLDANINQPTELSVASDGRVFFLDRTGKVRVWRPSTQTTITSGTFNVDVTGNHGLLALALDPGFATNHWLYIYYSPMTPSVTRLSRFTVAGDVIDTASERVLFEVPTLRICCHEGSSIAFGADGNLYISTGDNTDPFESSGYAPIDERPGREGFDSQRSTANSQDLRGKILRIRPQTDGTYTIPTGNLFTSTSQGRLEIYAMGMRNPFRITVDPANNWVYFGDVGPDATNDGVGRGPKGYDEFNQVKTAGNYGWPYCIADNKAYNDYNFATGVSGALFNCAAPVNNSPNNTGALNLPAARPAWIWYPYGASAEFPAVGNDGSRAAMSGPVYHFNAGLNSTRKLPSYYDNKLFIFDWARDWIQTVRMDANGAVLGIERFLGSFTFSSPIDLELGPDGALYLLEWGAGVGHESGADAKLSRLEYKGPGGGNPVAIATGTPSAGAVPLAVSFSSAGSSDPENGALTFAWDFTADGTTDSTAANPSFTYTTAGNYIAKLTVTDPEGKTGTATVPITAGNTRPVVTLAAPLNGGFFSWAEQISFSASVTDVEDGSTPTGIACTSVQIMPGLGHDNHSHTDPSSFGCQGTLVIPPLPADHADGDVFYVVEGMYSDRGGAGGAAPLTGVGTALLQPKHKQAEHFSGQSGVQVQTTGDPQGGAENVWDIHNNDWISFSPMNLQNITQVTYRAASAGLGGTIEVHVDSPTGTLISTATIPVTGGWQTYTNVTANITNPGGTHTLYFVFKGGAPPTALFNLNWIDFVGAGISTPVVGGTSSVGTTYEAENATRSGVTVETLNAGYTGTGYADYASTPTSGTYIEWSVTAPTAGSYRLEFRYANGGGSNRPLEIKVGGTVVAASQAFNATGSWTTWTTVALTATLAAGTNLIRATSIGSSGPNIDSLSIPVYQAEAAALSSVTIESVHAGYTGTGYANYASVTGGYIEWTVNAPTAGNYTLEFRYANGSGSSRSLEIKVGTTVVNSALAFTATGAWTTWSTKTVTAALVAGANKVRATAVGVDGPNMDALVRR
jgi:glucose/arabinose dehydrogenase/PKD repeat protein